MKSFIVQTGLRAGQLTVYGTDWCKWTKKQRDYLTEKGIPFTYIDCEQQKCPASVTAFPTLDKDGELMVGFREL